MLAPGALYRVINQYATAAYVLRGAHAVLEVDYLFIPINPMRPLDALVRVWGVFRVRGCHAALVFPAGINAPGYPPNIVHVIIRLIIVYMVALDDFTSERDGLGEECFRDNSMHIRPVELVIACTAVPVSGVLFNYIPVLIYNPY